MLKIFRKCFLSKPAFNNQGRSFNGAEKGLENIYFRTCEISGFGEGKLEKHRDFL